MSNVTKLRLAARAIFDEALQCLDAGAAVRNAIRIEAGSLTVCDSSVDLDPRQKIYSIAVGKAAVAMAAALEESLGEKFGEGVMSRPFVNAASANPQPSNRWRYFAGGHPLPNENSLAAANEASALLERAENERALVIFLISGGGSAMLEWPVNEDIALDDLRAANQTLVECGASISEINSVRRTFSAVKGGRLAAHAPNCKQITLIVSDVPKSQERDVASGPSLAPPANAPDAAEVVRRYELREKLPSSILRAIDNQKREPEFQSTQHAYFVLLDNGSARRAAAHAATLRGFSAEIAQDIADEQIEVGCAKLLEQLATRIDSAAGAVSIISGGEFACPVRGAGIGGRNLETALRLAMSVAEHAERLREFVALCAGTDGTDGNSPAAGAIVDSTTIDRARGIGLDPQDFLNRSDSYSFFIALGDTITTGATGTNVRDLRILLAAND